jgi:lipoyl synthase
MQAFDEEIEFLQVISCPLTRSSYHDSQVRELIEQYPRQRV